MGNISLRKHPICLLVTKKLFPGNAAAVFHMLSCSHVRIIWKDAVFITEKYHWRPGSFIKSLSPAGSLHVLTTSCKAAIITWGHAAYGLSDAWQEQRRPSSTSCPHLPPVCWSGIPSAALHSLPPHYLAQHLSKSFFLITKLNPNIFIYLCLTDFHIWKFHVIRLGTLVASVWAESALWY